MSQHAIAEIAQIGCAGAGIWVVGRSERRRCEMFVSEQCNLERENSFRVSVPCLAREHAEIGLGRRERVDKGLMLFRCRSRLTGIMLYRSQAHERPQRNSGGGGPPLDALGRSMRPIVHPDNLRRQASPALPVRPSHRPPPRGNKSSNPSAPWSPLL